VSRLIPRIEAHSERLDEAARLTGGQSQQPPEGVRSADPEEVAGVPQDDCLHEIREQRFRRVAEPHVGVTAVHKVSLETLLESARAGEAGKAFQIVAHLCKRKRQQPFTGRPARKRLADLRTEMKRRASSDQNGRPDPAVKRRASSDQNGRPDPAVNDALQEEAGVFQMLSFLEEESDRR